MTDTHSYDEVFGYLIRWNDPTYRGKTSVAPDPCDDDDGVSYPLILQSALAEKDAKIAELTARLSELYGEIELRSRVQARANEVIGAQTKVIADLRLRCEAAENEREALKEYVIGKGWSLATVLANISAANRHKHCELIPKGAAIDAQRKEEGL